VRSIQVRPLPLAYIWWGVNFRELRLAMDSSLFSGSSTAAGFTGVVSGIYETQVFPLWGLPSCCCSLPVSSRSSG
jgi:hypothetical protein